MICRMNYRIAAWRIAIACLPICVAGCGGTYDSTVSGAASLDGKALTRGTVAFIPVSSGPPAFAQSKPMAPIQSAPGAKRDCRQASTK